MWRTSLPTALHTLLGYVLVHIKINHLKRGEKSNTFKFRGLDYACSYMPRFDNSCYIWHFKSDWPDIVYEPRDLPEEIVKACGFWVNSCIDLSIYDYLTAMFNGG